MTGPILPVEGRVFEDTIDGYFPLTESLRQMLVRQGFAAACIVMSHAPMMHLPGLAADAPVPLRLDQARAGVIRHLFAFLRLVPGGVVLGGEGRWRWLEAGPRDRLPYDIRLAEPAFLRGIGIAPGETESGWLGPVAVSRPSGIGICPAHALADASSVPDWQNASVWGPSLANGGIRATSGGRSRCGQALAECHDTGPAGGAILLRDPALADNPITHAMRVEG
jgi:hypothetical protein